MAKPLHSPIIEGMARALFVTAWADEQERKQEAGQRARVAHSGEDWMDVAPRTSRAAYDAAYTLAGMLEQANKKPLSLLFANAMKADGRRSSETFTTQTMRDFGHYLAMQSLGHGVSWFDNHAKFPLAFPYHFEFAI